MAGKSDTVTPGMRAYATDLKERLVREVATGQPMREAARRCHVAVNTVKRAVVQERETGSQERKPIPGYPRRMRPELDLELEATLRARLEAAPDAAPDATPDATVVEHCAWWAEHDGQQLSEATMWRAMRRLGWTQKKRHWQPVSATRRRAAPGVQRLRAQLDPEQLVFVDESGTNISLTRLYGWAPHHRRASGSVPRNHGKNTTLVAALAPNGLRAWLPGLEGPMETDLYRYLASRLLHPSTPT